MNQVILIGRLTADIEVRYSNAGMAFCHFTLAVDREKRKASEINQNEPTADFIRITVFGAQAENCGKYLSKGRQIAVSGAISTGSYTDKDGKRVFTTDVIASRVEFIGSKSSANRQTAPAGNYYASPMPPRQAPQQIQQEMDADIPEGFQMVNEEDLPF